MGEGKGRKKIKKKGRKEGKKVNKKERRREGREEGTGTEGKLGGLIWREEWRTEVGNEKKELRMAGAGEGIRGCRGRRKEVLPSRLPRTGLAFCLSYALTLRVNIRCDSKSKVSAIKSLPSLEFIPKYPETR